ncbi:EAL domain-containing protein [Aurantimonas sp. VKM B-3413]|uniref:EAL domain-containing protein n=1 Tax=Aurantimonas sp. VKM B-3413 TaxID=2779401 RepID=UPI001E3E7767|nr:EAL domain-containing protein [Aurantimonas sp. VKM B-3413]MCB8837020.1 EAL domain-containing protein [Aurantimonas sp. VKM B-3413]
MLALIAQHSLPLVLTALFVCVTMAAILVYLIRRAQAVRSSRRYFWMTTIALVAGVGVWTTHFVAMLGFRPDTALGYDLTVTLASLAIGVVGVGLPMALTVIVARRWQRGVLGALAGAGVGAMHFTGMAALQGCLTSYSVPLTVLAFAAGMVFLASAVLIGSRGGRGFVMASLIVAGVCALHFTAMSGLTITPVASPGLSSVEPVTLSVCVAMAALMLFVTAMAIAVGGAQRDERMLHETQMRTEHLAMLSTALANMSNGLVKISAQRTIDLYNDQARAMLLLSEGAICTGMDLDSFLSKVGAANGWSAERIARTIRNHDRWMAQETTTRLEHTFDDGRILSISCRPLAEGGAILTYDDVTSEREVRAEMAHMAFHDALTGLPNRRNFNETIEARLKSGDAVTVLMLDLDHFKEVNDTLGHRVGDQLLIVAAQRLRTLCGHGDAIFRIGGDEIAIVPEVADEGEALACAVISAFRSPFQVDQHALSVGCSVGLATSDPSDGADLAVQKADLALYRAKEQGRFCFAVYAEGMLEKAAQRRQTERELARATASGEFELVYQPLYGLPDRSLAGFEALIRWHHPTRGLVSPAEFIPLAEANGIIREIGAWVLDEACRQVSLWPAHIHVAVNVSPVQMRSADLLRQVTQCLDRYGLTPDRLEIELTETAMVEDGHAIAATLAGLRALGIRIAMDDFGTGYSSLAHLRDFQLDRIKIDRSFVDAAPDDVGAQAVLRAVTAMARELSIPTLAEGVERGDQLAKLVALGVNAAQGYLLGRPMQAAQATDLVVSAVTVPRQKPRKIA